MCLPEEEEEEEEEESSGANAMNEEDPEREEEEGLFKRKARKVKPLEERNNVDENNQSNIRRKKVTISLTNSHISFLLLRWAARPRGRRPRVRQRRARARRQTSHESLAKLRNLDRSVHARDRVALAAHAIRLREHLRPA